MRMVLSNQIGSQDMINDRGNDLCCGAVRKGLVNIYKGQKAQGVGHQVKGR